METRQLTFAFPGGPAPVLLNFPLRETDAEIAALRRSAEKRVAATAPGPRPPLAEQWRARRGYYRR